MGFPSTTTFLPSTPYSLLVFMFYFSMHASISSNARNLPEDCSEINGVVKMKLRNMDCFDHQQAANSYVGVRHHQRGSPRRRINNIRVEFDSKDGSKAKKDERETRTTKSSGRHVVGSSSSDQVNFTKAREETEVSGGSGSARGGREEVVRSENKKSTEEQEDIIEMDYHPPHGKSPIHNK